MVEKLAAVGGTPVICTPLPSVSDVSGRDLGEEEIRLVTEVIRSGRLNRVGGGYVTRFEEEFARLHGAPWAVASTSGTAALHVAVGAVNPDPGDEIVVAPITDMGSVIPILFQNAIPVFADVNHATYTVTEESISRVMTERTRAIIVVHLFGAPVEMEPILKLAKSRGVPVIEDCAQAYLAEYQGRLVGSMGDLGCFSMQQSKHMTTGDGGMTLVNNPEYESRARLFADKGWPREGEVRDHLFLAPNYRMSEITAAVGLAQLGKLRGVVERRRAVAEALTRALAGMPGIEPPPLREGSKASYWLYPFTLNEEKLGVSTSEFARLLSAEGVPVSHGYIGRPIFMCRMLQEQATYGRSRCPYDCGRASRRVSYGEDDCPNSWEALRRLLVLPVNEQFSEEDLAAIIKAFQKVYRAL
jgi:perosamine synthetase